MFVFIVLIAFVIACGFGAALKTRASSFIGALGPTAGLAALPIIYIVLANRWELVLTEQLPFPFEQSRFEFGVVDAVFMIPLVIVGFTVALFGFCLKKPEHAVMRPQFWFFLNIMYAGMMTMLIAGNAALYIIGWEIMSWAAFFLICTYFRRKEVRDAGIIYFIVAHITFLIILVAAFMFEYEAILYPSAIFLTGLVGFGAKAGLAPFHVWLPEAQTAAPGHVSALLAGVMCNMGIYMMWRLTGAEIRLLGAPPLWWGYCFLGMGAVSAFYGAVMALRQRNLKRLLAYSVVQNTGVIFMGIGLGYLAEHYGCEHLRNLLYLGCVLHMINHAVFKSLLFMAAGIIINQTEVSDIRLLAGICKRLPFTGPALVIGCAAAAGLPPLNGFIGEYLLFDGAIAALAQPGMREAAILMLAVLGVVSVLMLVCYIRLAGIAALGEPRCKAVASCVQSNMSLKYPLTILMGLCILSGAGLPFFMDVPGILRQILLGLAVLVVLAVFWVGVRRLRLHKNTVPADNDRAPGEKTTLMWTTVLEEEVGAVRFDGGERDGVLEYVFRPFFRVLYRCCMKMKWLDGGGLGRGLLYIALVLLILLVWTL